MVTTTETFMDQFAAQVYAVSANIAACERILGRSLTNGEGNAVHIFVVRLRHKMANNTLWKEQK